MKLCGTLLAFRNGRKKFEPVPFQELIPLKLRNSVSGKSDRTSDICCVQEMSILFACMKNNDFNEALCPKEVNNFKKCYHDYMNTKAIKKEREAKGILTPGEKRLSHKQVNKLLKIYPSV